MRERLRAGYQSLLMEIVDNEQDMLDTTKFEEEKEELPDLESQKDAFLRRSAASSSEMSMTDDSDDINGENKENQTSIGLNESVGDGSLLSLNTTATIDQSTELFKKAVDKANLLFANAQSPADVVLDAHIVSHLSRLCRQRGQELSTNQQTFFPSEFATKLVNQLNGSRSDPKGSGLLNATQSEEEEVYVNPKRWAAFGEAVSMLFGHCPELHFMSGLLSKDIDVAPVAKVKKQRSRLTNDKDLIKTKTVDPSTKKSEETSTEKLIESIMKQLVTHYKATSSLNNKEQRKAIPYFNFVIHPQSFSKTVENMFHVSFLVKEGKVRIFVPKESSAETKTHKYRVGIPYIEPLRKNHQAIKKIERSNSSMMVASSFEDHPEDEETSKDRSQVVVNISISKWEALTKAFKISMPPMII